MKMSRLLQQIRIWAYLATAVGAIAYLSYVDRHSFPAFIVAVIAMPLPFFEICGECGRPAWFGPGSNIFWIGKKCKRKSKS